MSGRSQPTICRYWAAKGTCFYESQCKFLHPAEGASASGPKGMAAPSDGSNEAKTQIQAPARSFVPSGVQGQANAPVHGMGYGMGPPQGQMPPQGVPATGMYGQVPMHHPQQQPFPAPNTISESKPSAILDEALAVPLRREIPSFFVNEDLRQEIHEENKVLMKRSVPEDPNYHELPLYIHDEAYHSLYQLQLESQSRKQTALPFPGIVYKVTSSRDGCCYALRRILGCRVGSDAARTCLRPWLQLSARNHPGIVAARDVFTTNDFNDGGSLCLVYDFYPCAKTLEAQCFSSPNPPVLAEETLWSYICQLVSVIMSVHSAQAAVRDLEAYRILLTANGRIRLNWCGLQDILHPVQKPLAELQYEDIFRLGKLILSLACQSQTAVSNIHQSMDYISRVYSPDLKNLVIYLTSKPKAMKLPTIFNVSQLISHRMVQEMQRTQLQVDSLRREVCKEVENGRILRLMIKMGFINERPEYAAYSETERQHLVKLFRDFIFHSIDEDGKPIVDFGHVYHTLNKLDAGTPERLLLTSRDHESLLVVSYGDLANVIETEFQSLKDREKKMTTQDWVP